MLHGGSIIGAIDVQKLVNVEAIIPWMLLKRSGFCFGRETVMRGYRYEMDRCRKLERLAGYIGGYTEEKNAGSCMISCLF